MGRKYPAHFNNMDPLHLVIYCIAIWRISSLFVNESGPFNIFMKIREWTGIQHDDSGYPFMIPDNFFAQLLSCIWCASIWISFFFTILWLAYPDLSLKIAVVFAFSGGAILFDRLLNHYGKDRK